MTKFKYLVSNVKLTRADGTVFAAPESYYLVDAAQPATAHVVVVGVPLGTYTGLSFVVGVDPLGNTAGAQTGALDRNNDLYGDWTAGYVFLKMEGTSPQAPTPRPKAACASTSATTAPSAPSARPSTAARWWWPPATRAVRLGVNVQALFDNAADASKSLDFGKTSGVMGGAGSTALADNYAAGMFTLRSIDTN